jgi:microsomal epoxide hydrolase
MNIMQELQPFKIDVPQSVLDDLQQRLAHTRWTDELPGAGWDYGANLAYMKELIHYWQAQFDWRKQEAMLNRFPQFRAEVDGLGIHFIYVRGKGPDPIPIIITHGWPGSFFEIIKLIPLLTDPAAYGGDPVDAFDLVIPSLPGFGFSDRPKERGFTLAQTAGLWAKLMTDTLGYKRFAAGGGDFGAMVTHQLMAAYSNLLIGVHLTYNGYYLSSPDPSQLSEAERRYVESVKQWTQREGGYAMIQSTKPQTLAYGLHDSPAGLAAWLTEKYRSWTDCNGEIERCFSKDELLTHIMIYWVSGTINSSMRTYFENKPQKLEKLPRVPAAFAAFPKELNTPPREWVERRLQLDQWTEMPRGGHFAAIEEPELLAKDIQKFFRNLHRK